VLVDDDTVRIEEATPAPAVTEGVFSAHFGAGVPPPLTLQASETVPV